eukprot:TRINITY_DN54138_c0_g1_i1.p2 TRINITY_DN54138_c0_g1~~TRINITY_DN54138_c0_g1_i1.p2  ORF type:complete len:564 (-),score=70.01 TRINITY_DN54138_c0_g1_i1:2146-3792(-)
MADDPYYHDDGTSFRLRDVKAAPSTQGPDAIPSSIPPARGTAVHGVKMGALRPRTEQLETDKDMPLAQKTGRLISKFPDIPPHALRIMVHDCPEMSIQELAEILQHMEPEEIEANCHRELPDQPTTAPPLPLPSLQHLQPRDKKKKRRTARIQDRGKHDETNIATTTAGTAVDAPSSSQSSSTRTQQQNIQQQTTTVQTNNTTTTTVTVDEEPVWSCPSCTLHNIADLQECSICGTERPKDVALEMVSLNDDPPPPATPNTNVKTKGGGSNEHQTSSHPKRGGGTFKKRAVPKDANALALANSPVVQNGRLHPQIRSYPFKQEPKLFIHEELQPGLVIIKGLMDIKTQQWVVDETWRLGTNPDGRSGGFFKVMPDGGVELNQGHRGNFGEYLETFAPHFKDLCHHFFGYAKPLSEYPDMDAQWCNFNFYGEGSKGIMWHIDGDETKERIKAGTGRPVVSFSLGCSCDFRWKNKHRDEDNVIRLNSGDVLVFGGKSRGILHSVTKIHPNTCPPLLRMRKNGRLNLTYRHRTRGPAIIGERAAAAVRGNE